jgi:hypothetical protein
MSAISQIVRQVVSLCRKPKPNYDDPSLQYKVKETWYFKGKKIELLEADQVEARPFAGKVVVKLYDPEGVREKNTDYFAIHYPLFKLYLKGWGADGFPDIAQKGKELHCWSWKRYSISLIEIEGIKMWRREEGHTISWTPHDGKEGVEPVQWEDPRGLPQFIPKVENWWFHEGKEAAVFEHGGQVLWRLSEGPSTSFSPAENLPHLPSKDRVWRFRAQTLNLGREASSGDDLPIKRDFFISSLDPKCVVSEKFWTVTLVDMDPRDKSWGGHAAILIESVENRLPAALLLHLCSDEEFRGKVKCESHPFDNYPPFYAKGETHLLDKSEVQKMIESVMQERGKTLPFNYLGKGSLILIGSHNCMSWAREKLSLLKIELGYGAFLFDSVRLHTSQITQARADTNA